MTPRFTSLLVLVVNCFAQAPVPEPPTIAGTVRDRLTGHGLAGVTVTVKPLVGPDVAVATTSTTGDGTYRTAVRPGIYRFTFERKGYRTRAFGGTSGAVPEPVVIAEGGHVKNLDVAMAPLSSITGKVTDEEGEPVGGALVHLLARRTLLGEQVILSERSVRTGATGEYRVEDVPDGVYYLGVLPPQRRRPPGGKPVGEERGYVATYYPGIAHLGAAPPMRVAAGEHRASIDVRLVRSRVYNIRGTVAGQEIESSDLILSLQTADNEGLPALLLPNVPLTSDLGFEFWDVPPGRYLLVARSKKSVTAPWARVLIEVAAQDVTDVRVQLVAPFMATGRITVPEGLAGKVKMERLWVGLQAAEGVRFGPSPQGRVSIDGSFSVGDVPAGRYYVSVQGLPEGSWLRSVRLGGEEGRDTGFELTGPGMPPIEVFVGFGQARIEGTVVDAKRQPAGGCLVQLTPDPLTPATFGLRRATATDRVGRFSLRHVAPGDYVVHCARGDLIVQGADREFLSKHQGVRVSIRGDESVQVSVSETLAESEER